MKLILSIGKINMSNYNNKNKNKKNNLNHYLEIYIQQKV
jgi:hypothetical protein